VEYHLCISYAVWRTEQNLVALLLLYLLAQTFRLPPRLFLCERNEPISLIRLVGNSIVDHLYSKPRCHRVGVGVLLAADSQSTSSSGYRALPLGPLTRFYLALLSSSDNYSFLLSKAPSPKRKRVCSLLTSPITILYRLI
jgi:hypothetical protein